MLTFEITRDEQIRINEWLTKVRLGYLKEHPERSGDDDLNPNPNFIYEGAIGGALSYCFTITSLGVVVKVKDAITGKELDLTNYDSW